MRGFPLGRVLGFEIRIDSSWFILLALILWSFSFMVFPARVPGMPTSLYMIMGVSGTALFFISLLAHELSHSLVARAKGIPVDGITLFLFGGMAHTRMEAETPGDEFQIAGVGPLSSMLIAVLLWGVAWLGTQQGWHPGVVAVTHYIAVLNVVLAVFNLVPGFPLDGGRLFRAIVWKVTGNVDTATRVATAGGRWFAYLLMAVGLLSAFAGNVIGGLWLVFIGWFLRNAAITSYQQHLLLGVLSGVRAGQAMTPEPETVPADASLAELMDEYFMRRRYGAYPVVRGSEAVGLITLQAVRDTPREEWPVKTAADVMFALEDSMTVTPGDSMVIVLDRIRSSPARRVLVLKQGVLLGVITASDIAFWLERARLERADARG